jgi:hypothetical protein
MRRPNEDVDISAMPFSGGGYAVLVRSSLVWYET